MLCNKNYNQYFNILNIEPTINKNEIKKAYRKLSIKYHPDKNNGIQKDYENIKNAYEKILDAIDNNNLFELSNSKLFNNNYSDNLDNLDNLDNPNNYLNNNCLTKYKGNDNFNNINIYKNDIEVKLEINFNQSFYGCSYPIEIERLINNYNLITKEYEKIYVSIPKSSDNNEIILIPNKGNCFNNNYSNIKIIIKLLDHNLFKRDGLDLIFIKNISLKEALLGINFNLLHLNSKTYIIKNKPGQIINPNTKLLMRNLGFIRDNIYGNLIIQFNIEFPNQLSNETIDKIKELQF